MPTRTRLAPLALVALWPFTTGFVLLSSKKATLPVSVSSPILEFQWDGNAPTIKEKDKYASGEISSLSDAEFMVRLLADAMDIWNSVPGAYITLTVKQSETTVKADREDKVFSIITEKSSNLSSAAYAQPNIPDDSDTIIDCDITIADHETAAKDLAYTITHELGHCLGLGHEHTNYNAIMGYSRGRRDLALGADDIAGIIYLYPDPKYGDGIPKEAVSCSRVGGGGAAPLGAWGVLAAPLMLAAVMRRRTVRRLWNSPLLCKAGTPIPDER